MQDHVFRLYINLDNEAFQDAGQELARILRAIAKGIEQDGVPTLYQTIYDVNGNDVGRFAAKHKDYR